ncbi:hypothetical protein [Cupriavidus basilensis]
MFRFDHDDHEITMRCRVTNCSLNAKSVDSPMTLRFKRFAESAIPSPGTRNWRVPARPAVAASLNTLSVSGKMMQPASLPLER